MKLKASLLKFVSPSSPADVRLAAARRSFGEELCAADEITVLFILGFDRDEELSSAAKGSLQEYPLKGLLDAMDSPLDPLLIKKLLELRGDDDAVKIMAALNPGADDSILADLVEHGPDEVIAVFSEDAALLEAKPFLKEALRKNPRTPNSVRVALSEKRSARAEKPFVRETPGKEGFHLDLTDEARSKVDEQNIYKVVAGLNTGQKLKLALSGNKAARDLLIKDSNRIISMAVLKNPRITEEEVQKVAHTKGTSDDMLRQISKNKEWVKSYSIRVGMLTNPKTPLTVSLKLLDTVYEKDLHSIAKSKNIPNALASAARRKLEAKGKG